MRETVVRRGLLILILVAVLGMLVHLRVQADVRDIRQTILEAYIVSPVPESDYNLVEEAVAAEITEALMVKEIPANPPVKFKMISHIYALIVSPREEIAVVGSGEMFYEELSPARIEALEYEASTHRWLGGFPWLEPEDGLVKSSALITKIGGIASDPPQVTPADLVGLIWKVAHEWGHKHLQLYPLCQHYSDSPEMTMINEVVADIIAEEITRHIIQRYGWEIPVRYEGTCDREGLRPIRITVDQLLAEGAVEEAEAYMKAARLRLCTEEDWCPRKLNQAFFAFCEPYGGGAEGDSPIPNMLKELRARYPSLKEFLEEIREVSSYEDFLSLLGEKGISYPEGQ